MHDMRGRPCADDVIITDELDRRPSRAPDYEAESKALRNLADTLAAEPDKVLQRLTEVAMKLTRADTAGISLLEPGGEHGMFRWVATAGAYAEHLNGLVPREASPCGEVMARDSVLLFHFPERIYPAFRQAGPVMHEGLLAPFHIDGEPAGTVWVVKHTPEGQFEREDARILESLSRFAAAAYQMTSALETAKAGMAELERRVEERTKALRESEERRGFLLSLSDALRPLETPADIAEAATRLLGERIGADRVCYGEIVGDHLRIERDYARGVPSIVGEHSLESFDREFLAAYKPGEIVTVKDVASDARLGADAKAPLLARSIAAFIDVVLLGDDRQVSVLAVQQAAPRNWTAAEETLMRDLGERVRSAVERARAEAGLRESEARLVAAFESVPAGVAVSETTGRAVIANEEYRRFLPSGVIPSRDPAGPARWRGWDGHGRPLPPQDFPGARAMRGERVVPGQEMLYTDDNGREIWTRVATVPIRDAAGQVTGQVTVIADIDALKRSADALRESEERLRLALDAADMGSFVWNVAEDRAEADRRMLALFGLPPDSALGLKIALETLLHPDDRERYAAAVARATDPEGDGSLREDIRVVWPDGTPRWLAIAGQVAFEGSPRRPTRMAGTAMDITERKRAEVALRESEERFRSFAETSSDTLWIIDAESGKLEYLSPAYETMWGEPRDAILADIGHWASRVHPEDRVKAAEGLQRLKAGERYFQEYRIIRPDGAVRYIHDTGFPILENGKLRRLAGVAQDLTERRLAEQAVAEAERRARTLMEGVPQLVWRAVDAGEWTWASPQWTAFTGQSEPDSHGMGWLACVHPDDRDAALEAWAHAEEAGGFDVEYRLRRVDGEYSWFTTRATPVRDETGHIVEWLGTSTDIHALRQLQERQGVLVAELQHRTRNLIGVVRSLADRTLDSAGSLNDFRDRFALRLSALSRVQGLLSHLSAGQRVAFDELLRSELTALGATDGLAERLVLEGPAGVPLRSATVQTFALALHELATNAVKYGALSAAHSGGHLAVRWHIAPSADGTPPRLHVDWRESGVTMPQVNAASQRGGYGRELIERALPYQLKAKTTYELRGDGVHCTLTVPIAGGPSGVSGRE